jgi:hypothetical protein
MARDEYYEMKERAKKKAREADQQAMNASAQAAGLKPVADVLNQADEALEASRSAYKATSEEVAKRVGAYTKNSAQQGARTK